MNTLTVHEIPEITLMYASCITTRETMARDITPLLADVASTVRGAGLVPLGNAMLVYRGASAASDYAFELWAGVPVPSGTEPLGRFSVARLPGFRCATTVHIGPSDDVDEAYGDLLQTIHNANLEPTPEIREEYLHHEPTHPDNDVTWLQVGLR